MMKKNLKHVAAIMLLIGFVVLALGSMGSSPSPSSSGGSSGGSNGRSKTCSADFRCYIKTDSKDSIRCDRRNCPTNAIPPGSGYSADCNCAY